MKRLIILILLLLLTSCNHSNNEYSIEENNLTKVYAYSTRNEKIEEVYVEYEIKSHEDVFNLYTIHQNYLPLNYTSEGSGNVKLISSKIEDNIVYYEVDVFIKAVENLDIFHKLLAQANADLGYSSVEIIYNNEKIS